MLAPVTLDELDSVGKVMVCDEWVAAALGRTGLVEVRREAVGDWRLLPAGRVGAVRIGEHQVQVNPKEKVALGRLLFLLGYAKDPGFRPEDVHGAAEPDLWPALAESLARQAETALARGLLQGYHTVDEAERVVRGRIRIGDQISRRPGQVIPLEITYDEYSVDIPENRLLRTAVRRMLMVPGLSGSARGRLSHLDARMNGVGLVPAGARLPSWRRSRLNARYQPALRLADIVLRNLSTEAGPGGLLMASFVVEMWRVFEDFVSTALKEALSRRPGHTELQRPEHLDELVGGGALARLGMRPDVVHVVGGSPRLVFDAKYKVADTRGRYANADHYQMLAYCTAMRLPMAWLVYAQGAGGATRRQIRNVDISVFEYPLDLSAAPADLLDQTARLAEMAWGQRAAHPVQVVSPIRRSGTLAKTNN